MQPRQVALFTNFSMPPALSVPVGSERGAIFTRREIVEFILDIAGYTPDRPLWEFRLLEPSFGHGDFLIPAVSRLLQAYKGSDPLVDLAEAIRAVEIHLDSVAETRRRLLDLLSSEGVPTGAAHGLCDAWLLHGDFLLTDIGMKGGFTHVVGNPPYVRQEMIADYLMAEYRARYATIFDRADLYVPFFERSLSLMAAGGVCCMICSDRWMKNRYGAPLRQFVSSGFHLAAYVDMVGVPAFEKDVIAYPAITSIIRGDGSITRLAFGPEVNSTKLTSLASALRGESHDPAVSEMCGLDAGSDPWLLQPPGRTELIRRLEAAFPTIEEAGCKVGIGVATGADKAFIAPFADMDVEPSRKLPIVTTKDIVDGTLQWRGLGLLNPFEEDGSLAKLTAYPKMAAWLERHGEAIRKRHVAKNRPGSWYRTIDRIFPGLADRPKLLVPDIKGSAHVVLDPGGLYPHHNLYYIVSNEWDLCALKAVLESGIGDLFVGAYSVKMASGRLRFQAQYLRRIRLPRWSSLHDKMREGLLAAIAAGDNEGVRAVVYDIYGLSAAERLMLDKREMGDAAGSRGVRGLG